VHTRTPGGTHFGLAGRTLGGTVKAETIVVIGRGSALDSALDAQGETGLSLWRFPTIAEASRSLPGHERPRVGAVLLSLLEDADAGLHLIGQLRALPAFRGVPIIVWASAASSLVVWDAYALGASSALLLTGTDEDAVWLSRTIHYWKALNEPGRPVPTNAGEAP
jgi:hypothetical protein